MVLLYSDVQYLIHEYKDVWIPFALLIGAYLWMVYNRVDKEKHWQQNFNGTDISAEEFYKSVQTEIEKKSIPDIQFSRADISEKRYYSNSREYLRIVKDEFEYYICAAPYGNTFFVSMWHFERPPIHLKFLNAFPRIKEWAKMKTYYQIDLDGSAKSAIEFGFEDAINALSDTKGIRVMLTPTAFKK
jgi:hypothetical protein